MHVSGGKKLLLTNSECSCPVTQIAVAYFKAQEYVEKHSHPTMEEFFYCLKGCMEFSVEKQTYILRESEFLKIPKGNVHSLRALSDSELFYWGVAL